ncbi:MAG TPA: cytochrome c biogenesis protein CcsA [Vicinamibacterales bacterium]|nr:cytochrome c biogenesis protein CcsA [Vicinamibacterales bacterium]
MPKWFNGAGLVCALMFAASPFVIAAAPYESTMGLVQKIFYYHMPSAWMFLLGAIVCGIASARYLASGDARHDRLAWAAAELTVLFGLLTLVTGPLWARRAWGTWWVWDARVTSSLVGWMIACAYLLLRRYGGPGSEKLAAGVALFGMANVPFIYVSVNYWRTIHPKTTVVPTLPVSMGLPLWFCVAAFALLFVLLLRLRVRLEEQRARVDALYLSMEH